MREFSFLHVFYYLLLSLNNCAEFCLVKGVKVVLIFVRFVLLQLLLTVVYHGFPHAVNVDGRAEDIDLLKAPPVNVQDDVLKEHAFP